MEAPWSRAAPVKLWTRCSKLSLDLAGLAGALVPRGGAFPNVNERSGAFEVETDPGAECYYIQKLLFKPKSVQKIN